LEELVDRRTLGNQRLLLAKIIYLVIIILTLVSSLIKFMAMPEVSKDNAAVSAAATNVHHAHLNGLPEKTLQRLYRGGIRSGEPSRTTVQAQAMLDKIPPACRAGSNGQTAAANTQDYLTGKHASHIKPHSQGGTNDPRNITWESAQDNIARGNKPMTPQEQMALKTQWHIDNVTGAVKAGIKAAPLGAAIGAATTLPFSLLINALRVVRQEISPATAALETVKDTTIGGAVGGVTAFATTAIAAACPPIAVALTAIAPVLIVAGATTAIYQFFHILENHQQAVRKYYASLTQQELECLQAIENDLIAEHQKNLEFLAQAQAVNAAISHRPLLSGIAGAQQRYQESIAIAKSLGLTPADSKLIAASPLPALSFN